MGTKPEKKKKKVFVVFLSPRGSARAPVRKKTKDNPRTPVRPPEGPKNTPQRIFHLPPQRKRGELFRGPPAPPPPPRPPGRRNFRSFPTSPPVWGPPKTEEYSRAPPVFFTKKGIRLPPFFPFSPGDRPAKNKISAGGVRSPRVPPPFIPNPPVGAPRNPKPPPGPPPPPNVAPHPPPRSPPHRGRKCSRWVHPPPPPPREKKPVLPVPPPPPPPLPPPPVNGSNKA
jgi:hypothetical protein